MKRRATWIALAGLGLGTGAVIWLGAGQIGHAILRVGWPGLAAIVAWQFAVFVVLGTAWWIVCPGAPIWLVVAARLVREGGTTCLPLSVVGGLVFGARTLVLGGVSLARAAASSVVDVITEGAGLVPFLIYGLVMLLARQPGSSLALALGLGIGLIVGGGILAALLRRQLGRLLRASTEWLLRRWIQDAPQQADEMHRGIGGLFGRPLRVGGASFVHALSWCGGAGNVWIGYHLLGARPTIPQALAIEAIFSGALSIGLLVPGAFGVQEVSYVGIGRLFGMPAPLSLALSLLRRARDIIIGGPALLAWQAAEARRLRGGRSGQGRRPRPKARSSR